MKYMYSLPLLFACAASLHAAPAIREWTFQSPDSLKSIQTFVDTKADALIRVDRISPVPGSAGADGALAIDVIREGMSPSSAMLWFPVSDAKLAAGKRYRMEVEIRADRKTKLELQCRLAKSPWTTLAKKTFQLSADRWQTLRLDFTAQQETVLPLRGATASPTVIITRSGKPHAGKLNLPKRSKNVSRKRTLNWSPRHGRAPPPKLLECACRFSSLLPPKGSGGQARSDRQ